MTPEQIILIAISLVLLLLIGWVVYLERRLKQLVRGTNKEDLATGLLGVQKHEQDFIAFKKHTEITLKHIDERLKRSIQYVATVRFDPFKGTGTGGNQSFATAFLDENSNGVVISTIHARERVGVFSKPLKHGTSEYELTPEEASVIEKAKSSK